MTYDDWKTTPPCDDEPDVEACGHRVGTCEGECRLDTEPAPALEEENEPMTPKELLELAKRHHDGCDDETAAALRSYAELTAALLYLDRKGAVLRLGSTYPVDPESVIEFARELDRKVLEET